MQKERNLKITDKEALLLYKTASKEWKDTLESNFGKEFFNQNITDRIKTLEDIYNELNIKREDIIPFKNPINKQQLSVNAFIDIQNISKVLNEDWIEDWDNSNQYKYYPWFEKKKVSGWCFDCSHADCYYGIVGFGFYYKTSEIAKYVGNQFLKVYQDYLPK